MLSRKFDEPWVPIVAYAATIQQMKKKILLLEDDAILHETLVEFLSEAGFDVYGAFDGERAEDLLYERTFDILLLDVNVPKKSGFEVLKSARGHGVQTPALFLTTRDGLDDVEKGFLSGADDYVRKPFALKELLLRVQSLLLRRFSHPDANRLDLGEGLTFDLEQTQLYRHGEMIRLAEKPRRLLQLLIAHRGEILSHARIAEHLWGYDEVASDAALRTYIKTIRSAVGKARIVSHKRSGYQFS